MQPNRALRSATGAHAQGQLEEGLLDANGPTRTCFVSVLVGRASTA